MSILSHGRLAWRNILMDGASFHIRSISLFRVETALRIFGYRYFIGLAFVFIAVLFSRQAYSLEIFLARQDHSSVMDFGDLSDRASCPPPIITSYICNYLIHRVGDNQTPSEPSISTPSTLASPGKAALGAPLVLAPNVSPIRAHDPLPPPLVLHPTLTSDTGVTDLPTTKSFPSPSSGGLSSGSRLDGLKAFHAGDYARALGILTPFAEGGDVISQTDVGWMYQTGQGVGKSPELAAKWFQKAAARGYAPAQYDIGVMYSMGAGVERNLAKAISWYKKAAEQGNPNAQYSLGLSYERGRGVEVDIDQALNWYQKAADQGNADAARALSTFGKKKPNSK